jgi:hypothetical protein
MAFSCTRIALGILFLNDFFEFKCHREDRLYMSQANHLIGVIHVVLDLTGALLLPAFCLRQLGRRRRTYSFP